MADTNKQITDLDELKKLNGKESVLVDNGEYSYRTTIDTLLGYIANQINAGTFPSEMLKSTSITVIPEGTSLPASARVDGNFYIRECNSEDASNIAVNGSIIVSPNMGLKIVSD